MKRRIVFVCFIALLLITLPLSVFAQGLDYDRTGSITVTLVDPANKEAIAGVELSVYYVATVGVSTEGKLVYTYTEPFKSCGSALDDPELSNKLDAFLNDHPMETPKMETNLQGTANYSGLELGLYFVKQTNTVSGYAPCKSFLVTVPFLRDGEYLYDVDATPKTEITKLTPITIKKVWNRDRSTSMPDSVTIQLLRNKKVVEEAVLSSKNQWQVTFNDMPVSDEYSVQEINIPRGYTVTYGKNGYVFTVTNTAGLIQTGQLTWPIPILAVTGLLLLAAGTVILRKESSKCEE